MEGMYFQDFLIWDIKISGYHLIQEQDKKKTKKPMRKQWSSVNASCGNAEFTMESVQVQNLRTDCSASLQLLR